MNNKISPLIVYITLGIFAIGVFGTPIVLQNGTDGYSGCEDAYIHEYQTTPFGTDTSLLLNCG